MTILQMPKAQKSTLLNRDKIINDLVLNKINDNINMMTDYRKSIEIKLEEGSYYKHTSSNNDAYSYTMEVVDVIDDFVIAKITSSRMPSGSFIYRVDDQVMISE